MTTAMGCKTLVLSSDWRPINILPVLRAIKKVFSGRAKCLDPESYRIYDYEDWLTEWSDVAKVAQYAKDRVISLAGTNLVLPEVIVCTDYHGLGFKANPQRSPKFSRRNLVLRDRGTCFGAGTMVLMADGYQKPIEHVVVGDRVIDADGNPSTVTGTGNRFANDVVSVVYRGSQIRTIVTRDHPFLSSIGEYKPIGEWAIVNGKQKGIGDYMVCPRAVHYEVPDVSVIDVSKFFHGRWFRFRDGRLFWSKRPHEPGFPSFLKTSPDLAYLMGLYCAEGSSCQGHVDWALHEKETTTLAADIKRIVEGIGLNVTIVGPEEVRNNGFCHTIDSGTTTRGHGIVVRTCSKVLSGILSQTCGAGAYQKHTPWELIGKYRKEYLKGLLLGDGYIAERFNKVAFNVASVHLVMDVQAIALGMGIHCTLQRGERPDGRKYWSAIFQGINYVRLMKEVLDIDVIGETPVRQFGNDQYVFRKLRSVSDAEPCVVYNIEVDGSHSYIANGVVVHNCQFCGKKFPVRELTMDHIVPRSKGGEVSWTNIVCACSACNNRKADKSLKDSGMKLIRRPVAPTQNDLRLDPTDRIRMQITSRPPKTWDAFLGATINTLYWNTALQDD